MSIGRPNRAEIGALAAIIILALTLLWTPPLVGLADNGDFYRLLYWGKFEYLPGDEKDRLIGWFEREFQITRHPLLAWYGFPSSEAIFIKASALLALLWPGGGRFDIRVLGLVHALAFAAACYLLLKGWRAGPRLSPVVLYAGLLLLFCDLGYLVYFHSFYGETASLIFLLGFTGAGLLLAASEQASRRMVAVFLALAFLFIIAKPQNLPFIAPLALCSWRLVEKKHRRTAAIAMAFMIVVAAGLYLAIPRGMKEANLYNSTFNGILRWSSSPESAIEELGLDKRLAVLAGSNYFETGLPVDIHSEQFRSDFYERMSPVSVIVHYLRHPATLYRAMKATTQHAYTLQPAPFGNFERSAGYPFRAKATRWTLWSRFKDRQAPRSVIFTTGYMGLLLGAIGILWRRGRAKEGRIKEGRIAEFYLALWMMMLISLIMPIIGDGESDIEKHLFLYNAFFDLSLLFLAGYLARGVRARLDARLRS